MLNILKSDFYKLRKSRAFWICTLVCMVLAVLFASVVQAGVTNAEAVDGRGAAEMLATVLFTGFNIFVIAVFVPMFTASEFQYGTIKNTLSRGAGRVKVFFSKFIVCACADLVMLMVFILAFLASGSALWGYDPNGIGVFSGLITMIPLQALMIIAYTALFTFTSMTLRGTVGAIATNVASLAMVTMLLSTISTIFSETFNLADYWIGWGVSNLATLTPASGDIIQGVIIALAWSVASIAVGTTLFKKVDVK